MSTELHKGEPVRYFPGFRDGPSRLGKISYTGLAKLGGTEGYYITGIGFVSAGHIEPLDYKDGVIEVKTATEALEVCTWDGITDVVITDNMERILMQKLMRGLR